MYLSSSDEKHVAVLIVLAREAIFRLANAAVLSGGVGIDNGDCGTVSYIKKCQVCNSIMIAHKVVPQNGCHTSITALHVSTYVLDLLCLFYSFFL